MNSQIRFLLRNAPSIFRLRYVLIIQLFLLMSAALNANSAVAQTVPTSVQPFNNSYSGEFGGLFGEWPRICGTDTTIDGAGNQCANYLSTYLHNNWISYTYTGHGPVLLGGPYTPVQPNQSLIGISEILGTIWLQYTVTIGGTSQFNQSAAYVLVHVICPSVTTWEKPYSVDQNGLTCSRPDTLIITLSGSTTVEPWHKKFDADHKKMNLSYTATVTNTSGQPSPNIPVTITTDVTQDSGGHVHIDSRPKGKLVATPSGTPTPVSTVGGKETILGTTDSNGIFSFTFGSEEASGTHTITAKCTGCQAPATATVKVEIPGLSMLDGNPLSYTLNGEKSWHPGSHYFSAAALTKIINLAHKFSHDPAFSHQLLIINDSSLIKGGVFDLGQDWTYTPNGHQGHRIGVVVDINNFHAENPDFVIFAKNCCSIKAVWEGPDVTSTPHYHLWLIGKDQ